MGGIGKPSHYLVPSRRSYRLDQCQVRTGSRDPGLPPPGSWRRMAGQKYPVYLDTTPCHMGGERHWFLCPARGCGRRVAVLYGGAIFACRHCYRLAYPSHRERDHDRATRRADRIRDRMGWPGGILEGGDWGKPKGMHWRTYERLCREHDTLSDRAMVGIMDHLNRLSGRF